MREPVAIIIPSYNYAAFLAEAIESALAQTHPEVVVTVVALRTPTATSSVLGNGEGACGPESSGSRIFCSVTTSAPRRELSRAAFLEVGGYMLPARGGYSPRHEDWDLWLRMARHGYRGVYVDSALVWWRRHETGSRNIETSEQWPAVVAVFEERFADLYGRILFKVLQRPLFNRVVPWLRSRHARTGLERVDSLVFRVPARSRPS